MRKFLLALVAALPLATGYVSGIFSLPVLLHGEADGKEQSAGRKALAVRPAPDVTGKVENLGNPFARIYPSGEAVYARNVWDLQFFANKIFIGGGNSSNKGPASNAGPVPIQSYDLRSGQFSKEGGVAEEQIDLFRILNHQLYIPGHDPTESWEFGNFYRRNNDGTWSKYRNIPEGLHVYDMAWHNGRLYAALGTKAGGAVMRSVDQGKSWEVVHRAENRVYSFLLLQNTLFAASKFPTDQPKTGANITRSIMHAVEKILLFLQMNHSLIDAFSAAVKGWAGGSGTGNEIVEIAQNAPAVPRFDLGTAEIFPDTALTPKKYAKIIRPVAVDDKLAYIGAYIHNDHQYLPFGLYVATSPRPQEIQTIRIPLPARSTPWDIISVNNLLYILLSTETENGGALIQVLKAPVTDLTRTEEIFRFNHASFARSFEVVDGDFYFGIGSEVKNPKMFKNSEISPQTGEILRLGKQSIESTPDSP